MSTTTGPSHPDENTGAAVAQTAKGKAGEAVDVVGEQAAKVADTAEEQVTEVAEETQVATQQLIGELRDQIKEQTQVQGQLLADQIRSLTRELRRMSEHGSEDSLATSVVRRVADNGDRVADELYERGPEGLLDEVKVFARRKPGLFLAGAALAGFAVSRAGKGVRAASDGNSANHAPAEGGEPTDAVPPADRPSAPPPGTPPPGDELRDATEPGEPAVAPTPVPPVERSQQTETGR